MPPQAHANSSARWMEKARSAYQAGDVASAINLARALNLPHGDEVEALAMLAEMSAKQGHIQEALYCIEKALAERPAWPDAHFIRANWLQHGGRFEEAIAAYDHAIRLNPSVASFYNNKGAALKQLGRMEEASASYKYALGLLPEYAEASSNLGLLLGEMGQSHDGLGHLQKAVQLQPDFAQAHNNLGIVLGSLGRYEEAFTAFERALSLNSNYAEAYNNYGYVLQEAHRYEAAAQCYDKAISLMPDYVAVQFNKSLLLLLLGNFSEGWPLFEWRWKIPQAKPLVTAAVQWKGDFSLEGKTILLHAEQGLGDTLQFVRYVPMVQALGARVILQAQKPVLPLLASMATVAVTQEEEVPSHDCHASLMSLPLAFATDAETIPACVPYLNADDAKVAAWRTRLPGRRAIGLVWSGNASHKNNHNRSMALEQILGCAQGAGLTFVALQKEITAEERALLDRHHVLHFAEELHDFSDTAALIDVLELVISVDTSVAHLAGALAKPVWLLLPYAPDYRWRVEGETSAWYPTMRLFRQSVERNWPEVIAQVATALASDICAQIVHGKTYD